MYMKGTGGEAYSYADKHFREACKVILGGEVGELSRYEEWLLELKQPKSFAKSSKSGEEVVFCSDDYPKAARVVGLEEVDLTGKAPALNINEVKDIDSILGAVSERFAYCGNLVFGNSAFVEKSADVNNSFYVYNSSRVGDSKSIACSSIVKKSSYLFGCNVGSLDEYCVRCHQFSMNARCFEANICTSSSDCYYVYNCLGCRDIMFSFNQRNAVNAIGNLVLPKEKYMKLKAALMEQMRSELEAKRRLPAFGEIIAGCNKYCEKPPAAAMKFAKKFEEKAEMAPMEKAFAVTSSLVLGKELKLEKNKEWLRGHSLKIAHVKSALGTGEIPRPTYENLKLIPANRFVNLGEALALSAELKLGEKDVDGITLENASEKLAGIAWLSAQFHEGNNRNATGCPIVLSATDCLDVHGCVHMKKSAYSTWARDSEHVFGSAFVYDSAFCIDCYNSFSIQRCFEVDSARGCTGCYYSHNVENVHDSIFCSNVKNLRYAVANVEVGKEEFERVKKMALARVLGDLDAKKKPMGIYDFLKGKN